MLTITEGFLNYSGFIVRFIALSNFAEPLNFAMAPLFFLFLKRRLYDESNKKDLWHFLIFGLYLLYCVFHFAQSNEFKYNSYIWTLHPDWERLEVVQHFSDSPLGIRSWINELTGVHFLVYFYLGWRLLIKESEKLGEKLLKTKNKTLAQLRNSSFHINGIIIIFVFVKLYYGRDLGDYFISSYIALLIYLTAFQIIRKSNYFEQPTLMDFSGLKYKKSNLKSEGKTAILLKIEDEMEKRKFFTDNTASLSKLAKKIGESQHHVSQVINEKLEKSFFELLANYRVEEAKKILLSKDGQNITIEEIAEQVGYNSKSAFNNAFKKITGKTPSYFRT